MTTEYRALAPSVELDPVNFRSPHPLLNYFLAPSHKISGTQAQRPACVRAHGRALIR